MSIPMHTFRQRESTLQSLVENRTVYTLEQSELNVFETFEQCSAFDLRFASPVAVTMLEGRKVMHLSEKHHFDFHPNQTLILPAEEAMRIDFPDATRESPTRCLALAISSDLVEGIAAELNECAPRQDLQQWEIDYSRFHLGSDSRILQAVSQLVTIFTEDVPAKDILASLKLRELLVLMMQTQARRLLISGDARRLGNSRLAVAIDYIRAHLHEKISVEALCRACCMSRAQFFRAFKQELGISPVDFINQQRVRLATSMLVQSRMSVADISDRAGFESAAYFSRVFKYYTGVSPKRYQINNNPDFFRAEYRIHS